MLLIGEFIVHGETYGAWGNLWCMGKLMVHGEAYGAWGNLWYMGKLMVHGETYGAWGSLWCMGKLMPLIPSLQFQIGAASLDNHFSDRLSN